MGGWSYEEKDSLFFKMVVIKGKRVIFIKLIIDILRKFGFDGLDLDWEYLGMCGGFFKSDKGCFIFFC